MYSHSEANIDDYSLVTMLWGNLARFQDAVEEHVLKIILSLV